MVGISLHGVAARGDKGDSLVPDRRGVEAVVGVFVGKLTKGRSAEAHGHDADVGLPGRVLHGRVQVRHVIGGSLDQQDIGARCDGVGPFHVGALLRVPSGVSWPRNVLGAAAILVDDLEEAGVGGIAGGAADIELLVELLHVVADGGVGEGAHDGNRLALAAVVVVVAGEAAEQVEAVGPPDLSGSIAGPRRCRKKRG